MADTHPPRTYIKGSLSTIFKLGEEAENGYHLIPKPVDGLTITSTLTPANQSDEYPIPVREFNITAAKTGAYSVDFEYKNEDTGDVKYAVRQIFIFKNRFLGIF